MTILCGPSNSGSRHLRQGDLCFVLYGRPQNSSHGSAGAALLNQVQRAKLIPDPRAWDLLSLALSVICADTAEQRRKSPDGWTRQISLNVAVGEPDFWNAQKTLIENQLKFLTTDIWNVEFTGFGMRPEPSKDPVLPRADCVTLLSGGLDSLVGTIDLVADGKSPYAVSQVAAGDKQSQSYFASKIGGGISHLQLNHNVKSLGPNERSQRARSIIFLAYGVLIATALKRYKDGHNVDLFMCENGLISVNPPLTPARLGSLSTRTTHPIFVNQFQRLLNASELKVSVRNPYQFKTKGEMLYACKDQEFLVEHAAATTSCSRYARNGWKHCGRCVPCLIRRSAFHAWGEQDTTGYVYDDLSKKDDKHAGYDDVRCAAMATALLATDSIEALPSTNLNAFSMGDLRPYRGVLNRGIAEIGNFLTSAGVS